MNRRAWFGAFLVATTLGVSAATTPLFACGEKFLTLGLGTRYERSPAARQSAAILIYAPRGSDLAQLLTALSIEAALKKQGYRPTVVDTATDFDAVLRGRVWDVVVVDQAESERIAARVQNARAPHVVPVLTGATADEVKHAKQVYRTIVRTPTRNRVFLDTIEDALDLHDLETRSASPTAAH